VAKHKANVSRPISTWANHVIVVNAAQVVLTAAKAEKKFHYTALRLTRVGSGRGPTATCLAKRAPKRSFAWAVEGHVAQGPAGDAKMPCRKLKVYRRAPSTFTRPNP